MPPIPVFTLKFNLIGWMFSIFIILQHKMSDILAWQLFRYDSSMSVWPIFDNLWMVIWFVAMWHINHMVASNDNPGISKRKQRLPFKLKPRFENLSSTNPSFPLCFCLKNQIFSLFKLSDLFMFGLKQSMYFKKIHGWSDVAKL